MEFEKCKPPIQKSLQINDTNEFQSFFSFLCVCVFKFIHTTQYDLMNGCSTSCPQ